MPELITKFFNSFGDLDAAKKLVDPSVELIGVRAEEYDEMPLYGTFVGHEGLERFMEGLGKVFDPQLFAIDTVLENDEIGLAVGRFQHRVRDNDALHTSHWAVACRFKDGKITHYRFYEDTASLEEAYGIRTTSRETVQGQPA